MVVVFTSWYFFKHTLASQRQTPFTRGIHEEMFSRMALLYPQLWARTGPRSSFRPQTRLDKLRWHLILRWNDPDKTTRKTSGNEIRFEDLSVTTRLKHFFTNRWTNQLHTCDGISLSTSLEDGNSNDTASCCSRRNEVEAPQLKNAQSSSVTVANDRTMEAPMPTGESVPLQVPSRIASPTSQRSSIPGRDRSTSRRSGSLGRTKGNMVEERSMRKPKIVRRMQVQSLEDIKHILESFRAGKIPTNHDDRPMLPE